MSALKTYRERKGLSLAAMAAQAGTTAATLSRIENGKREPSLPLLKRILAAANGELTPADLIEQAKAEGRAA